ncbi:MAG: hypothetical protein LUE27_08255 [Clostridia bacterium]|nr:hypothetical protein [Clostridia bacterium]
MFSDPKFSKELDINSRENLEGARRFLEKYNGEDLDGDDCTVPMFLRCILDTHHAAEIDEPELLKRIKDTQEDPEDDMRLYAVMSALHNMDVYYLEDEDEQGKKVIPVIPVRIAGRRYKSLLAFTGEGQIPPQVRMDHGVRKGNLPSVLQKYNGGMLEGFRALSLNPFTSPLDIDIYDFMDAMGDMDNARLSSLLIMIGGIDGEDLFPIITDGFIGRNVACSLKNGIEVTGRVTDYADGTIHISLGAGGKDMSVPVGNIQNIAIHIPAGVMDTLSEFGPGN